MKGAYIEATGPAENIRIGEMPTPTPIGSQVLVKVNAASVNPIDTYIRSGAVAMNLPLPFIVGCDLAGVVESVGPSAKRFQPGDRVWGSNQGLFGRQGTFAEYAAVDECWLYELPDGVSEESAAAVALVGITAHLGLFRDAKLKGGETVFVNGGTGGVGSAIVQMAKAVGAKVFTTAGSDEKVQQCLELGADVAVNYRTTEVDQAIKAFAPTGVDVWWESLRDPSFERTIPLLAKRGRMVVMAGRDAKPVFPVGAFYTKDCKIFGFAMFNATPEEQQICGAEIGRWLAEGKLRANIAKVFPLSEAASAHRLQEENTIHKQGTIAGKIVVKP